MSDLRRQEPIPLAIVGMACRVPGADGLEPFWQMLVAGRSAAGPLPPERLDRELYYDPTPGARGKTYTDRGAVLSDPSPDKNAASADLPPRLARTADDVHRTLCQVAGDAFRHAGLDPLNLPQRNIGVYVGHTIASDRQAQRKYALGIEDSIGLVRELEGAPELDQAVRDAICADVAARVRSQYADALDRQYDPSPHRAAGLISQAFGLSGPYLTVNAACALSLQALHYAARALERGQIEMALVGGSSVCSRDWLVLFSQARSLSTGDSRPFDQAADGLVVGEAAVALVIKPLAAALADGDPIQAVIRGIGASSDGRGRSLWALRLEGQTAAIRRAYESGVDPAQVQYIEAHATATQLGDATEIASLAEVWQDLLPTGRKISIASVKANVGHTLEAAGLVAIVKTVLAMQHGQIPQAVGVETLNPKIDWANVPVAVPRKTTPWPKPATGQPRRAAVSAFGIGGLNLHVVLDAFDATAAKPAAPQAAAEAQDDAIAVIGMGCVLPGARDLASFWKAISSPAVTGDIGQGESAGRRIAGFTYDWTRHRIAPREIELADPLQFMVLDAADQAFEQAGLDRREFDRQRTGVIVGTEFAGDFDLRLQLALRLPQTQQLLGQSLEARGIAPERAAEISAAFADAWHARWPVLADNSGSYSASSLAVRIAKTWNLMGGAAAVDSGDTSALSALAAATDLLLAGDCDVMICAAAQRDLNAVSRANYRRAHPYSPPSAASAPFDRNGQGYQLGEGAGVLILKRLGDAVRDGDPIQAVLRGTVTVHDTAGAAPEAAIEEACRRAAIESSELALLVCDACGIAEADRQLVDALNSAPAAGRRQTALPLRSAIGQFGHTGGASGMASLLAAICALAEGQVPAAELHSPIVAPRGRHAGVQCAGPRAALAGQSAEQPSVAAVLSHGQGLASTTIVEQAPLGKRKSPVAEATRQQSNPPVATTSPAKIGMKPLDSAFVLDSLLGDLTRLTGYPAEVLDLDADLEADLDLRAAETAPLMGKLQERFGRQPVPPAPALRTIRQVVEYLQEDAAVDDRAADVSAHHRHVDHGTVQTNGSPRPAEPARIAHRSKLALVDAPIAAAAQAFRAADAVLILGDNPAAALLRERFESAGATVYHLLPGDGAERILENVGQLPADPPLRHVFLLTPLDPAGANLLDDATWHERRAVGVELPSLVLQKWGARLAKDRVEGRVTIAAATRLGGDFGVEQPVVAPEGGWVAGLLKSVNVELARHGRPATVKICDFGAADSDSDVVDRLVGELASEQPEVEVAWGAGRRRLVRVVDEPVNQLPETPLDPTGNWIITGGARGITAEVALMLGQQYGLNLHLIGRSPAPRDDAAWRNAGPEELKKIKQSIVRQAIAERKSPEKEWDRVKNDIEIHKNLERMRTLGLRVTYHSCDVARRPALAAVLDQIRRSGPIVGILHGAGYARTNRFESLRRDALQSTIDAKVAGAVNLMQLAGPDPLCWFVGFGSISGRFGGNGLSDYSAANEMLAKLCAWYRTVRPECATTCIEWQSWDEVGMAMLPDSTVGTRGVLKMQFLPPAEGVEHLRRELLAGAPAGEILIDDGQFERLLWTGVGET